MGKRTDYTLVPTNLKSGLYQLELLTGEGIQEHHVLCWSEALGKWFRSTTGEGPKDEFIISEQYNGLGLYDMEEKQWK